METIKQKFPAIKAFVLSVLESLLVLFLGVVTLFAYPIGLALFGFVVGLVTGIVSFIQAAVIAFSESK